MSTSGDTTQQVPQRPVPPFRILFTGRFFSVPSSQFQCVRSQPGLALCGAGRGLAGGMGRCFAQPTDRAGEGDSHLLSCRAVENEKRGIPEGGGAIRRDSSGRQRRIAIDGRALREGSKAEAIRSASYKAVGALASPQLSHQHRGLSRTVRSLGGILPPAHESLLTGEGLWR